MSFCDTLQIDETLLRVTDLKVHFPIHRGVFRRVVGQAKAVDGVSLDLRSGGTLALVGKGLLRLIPTTGGTVRFGDTELTRLGGRAMRGYRKDLQIIFQDPFAAMNPRMLCWWAISWARGSRPCASSPTGPSGWRACAPCWIGSACPP